MADASNIVLVGMPGAGKSTVGVLLAKRLSFAFLDTDVVIQERERSALQDVLERLGVEAFRKLEERTVCALDCARTVIATGGSVIYGAAAMRKLREGGIVVHLDVPLDELERRVTDAATRGLVRRPDQSLRDLYVERQPLYDVWADVRVDCGTAGHGEVCRRVAAALDDYRGRPAPRFCS